MNKNIIIAVLAISLVSSACLNLRLKSEATKSASSTLTADALFQRKQECASYRSDMESKLMELNFQNENVISTNHLDEIWFSPSLNSCLYSVTEGYQYLKESRRIEFQYAIYDYLENRLVIHIMEVPGSVTRTQARHAFENNKEELKK